MVRTVTKYLLISLILTCCFLLETLWDVLGRLSCEDYLLLATCNFSCDLLEGQRYFVDHGRKQLRRIVVSEVEFFFCTLRTRSRCTDTTLTDKQRFRRNRKHSQSQTEAHIGLHRARTSTNLRSTLCSPHHLLDNPANNRAGERIAQHAADLLRRDIDGQVGWERLEAQQFPRG